MAAAMSDRARHGGGQQGLRATLAFIAISCTAIMVSPANGADCQPGVNMTFYDLDEVQGQALAEQFPFSHGHGELLSSLEVSEAMLVPSINFGPPELSNLGGIQRALQPWPRGRSPDSGGEIAVLNSKMVINQAGIYTFFVVSDSPVEFELSHSGDQLRALRSGSRLKGNMTTLYGFEQFTKFNLARSIYDIAIEWHGGLPGAPVSEPALILEYEIAADALIMSSSSVPATPRTDVPAHLLYTVCDQIPEYPRQLNPIPAFTALQNTQDFVDAQPTLTVDDGADQDSDVCNAQYTVVGPWTKDLAYHFEVTFYITAPSDILPPYRVTIVSPNYRTVYDTFNMEVADHSGGGGVFEGEVTASWATLNSHNPVRIGGTFTTEAVDFNPASIAVNGAQCSLTKKN